jgi:hypothetical protein
MNVMKYKNLRKWLLASLVVAISISATVAYAQDNSRTRRLPDGTVIYADGTIKRTDGTIKFPDGRVKQQDGSIKFPDGTVHFPGRGNDAQWLPPGQAKKRYGTKNARPFAPGQRRKDLLINDNQGLGKGRK